MRRVLVIENQQLLGAGIENLLCQEDGLLVMGATELDDSALLKAISCSQADVVVLDEATTNSAKLLVLLENYPKLRVVVVSADDDLVRTYESHQVLVTQATELATLIKS